MLNQSSVSHKDIAARQQAGSSIFPWQQQNQSQSHQSQGAIETPLKRRGGAASSGFLWNAEETPVKTNQRISTSVSHGVSGDSSHQQMEQLRTLNHGGNISPTFVKTIDSDNCVSVLDPSVEFRDTACSSPTLHAFSVLYNCAPKSIRDYI